MNNLSIEAEFRYIVSWFSEFSELQREDFVPILVKYLQDSPGSIQMNGIVNGITNTHISDRPMSLFQCRIKLFREWTPKWPVEFKHKLKEKIIELDTKVGEKIINEIKSPNADHSNGNYNGSANNGADIDDDTAIAANGTEGQRRIVTDNVESSADGNDLAETAADEAAANAMPAVEPAQQVQLEMLEHAANTATTTVTVTPTLASNAELPLLA